MRMAQWKAALALAMDYSKDLSGFDDSVLFGFGLPEFQPVSVPLGAVAKSMRWQGGRLDGKFDMAQTNEDKPYLLKNVEISDWFTTAEAVEYQHEVVRKLVEGPEYAMGSTGSNRAD